MNGMEWLNYHHLLYFWMTARRGSISRAAAELLLAPPTISEQIASLEDRLGEKLFSRSGRRLTLTEAGKTVFAYADEIFSLGQEMVGTLRGAPTGRPMRLRVGVGDVLPRWIAYRLIEPALGLPIAVRLICYQRQPAVRQDAHLQPSTW
jgi:LysR family transcriptional activator of nhaA